MCTGQPLLNLICNAWPIALACPSYERSLHTVVPRSLPHPALCPRMPSIQDFVYPIAICLNLTLETRRKRPFPTLTLLTEKSLQLNSGSATRLIKQLEASNSSVSIEHDELVAVRRY